MKTPVSRRDFVQVSLAGLGTLCLPRFAQALPGALAAPSHDPHFFLQILIEGGMDSSYLFDARPLSMSNPEKPEGGWIQNYLGENPTPWVGENGATTWATRLTQPLAPFRRRFSVLNGVLMAPNFDGHLQNVNFLMTGDSFGGECFLPHLNQEGALAPLALDTVRMGNSSANLTNAGNTVPFNPKSAANFISKLRSVRPIELENPLMAQIRRRIEASSRGDGMFSSTARAMLAGYDQAPALMELIKQMQLPEPAANLPNPNQDFEGFPALMGEAFKRGLTRTALLNIPFNTFRLDTHAASDAKDQPKVFEKLVETLAKIFKALEETPFDGQRSLWDVTTVMVSSEFSRTMRQRGRPVNETGTDHNPLGNSVLLGGKGIRGGYVVGATDFQNAGEEKTLSKAHLKLDPNKLKLIGRPFDFATLRPRTDLPEEYRAADYLHFGSIANTIYSLFGVPNKDKRYRIIERFGAVAPVLDKLLV